MSVATGGFLLYSSFAAVSVDNFLPNKNSLIPLAFVVLVFTLLCSRIACCCQNTSIAFGKLKCMSFLNAVEWGNKLKSTSPSLKP